MKLKSIVTLGIAFFVVLFMSLPTVAEVTTAEPYGVTETDGLHVDFLLLDGEYNEAVIPVEVEG